MSLLRLMAVLAISFWIGGLAAIGGVAGTTLFAVLPIHEPSAGRELAGIAFGAVFLKFQQAAWIAGALLLISLGVRRALGPRPRWWGVRMWVVFVMLVASVVSARLIAPRIDTIRASVTGPVANLSDDDPRRVAFGRWHGLSAGLMVFTVVAGVGLIWTELRDQ